MHWFYFLVAWSFVALIAWNIWAMIRDSLRSARKLHQVPCAKCQFFTGSHYLKCPIHPSSALTEDAIGCSDFWPYNQ